MLQKRRFYEYTNEIKENIESVIVGKGKVIDMVMTSLIAGGHILLEDVPGTGKTVMAKSLARSLDASFSRVQFTPDLLPSDVTGLNYYNQKQGEFVFKSGPVFCNIYWQTKLTALHQEHNLHFRMHGGASSYCRRKDQTPSCSFIVIATQNPVETTGTFPLPEAQLDRFFMKLSMGLPSKEEELSILTRFEHAQPLAELSAVCTTEEIVAAQKDYKKVFVHPLLLDYMTELSQQSRRHPYVVTGVSPRGTLALLNASKAYAFLHERSFVVPEDIKAVAVFVLAHRLVLSRGVGSQSTGTEIIEKLLSDVAVPTENWGKHE